MPFRAADIVLVLALVPAMAPAAAATSVQTASTKPAVATLQIRPQLFMLTVDQTNVAVQIGPDGVIVVNPGPAGTSAVLVQAIHQLTSQPIRYVIDTSADPELVANNAALAQAGVNVSGLEGVGNNLDTLVSGGVAAAPIIAQQNVLTRMTDELAAGLYTAESLPSEAYGEGQLQKTLSLNGEPIVIDWLPAAHSAGDSVVLFRRSDVVVVGDLVDLRHFPVIDVANGGTVDGEIAALNRVLDMVVPVTPLAWRSGGTAVIAAHGYLCDQEEIVQFRDMLTIVRDRIRHWMDQGMDFQQILSENPTQGYTRRFGSDAGAWTTRMFIESIYRTLPKSQRRRR